MIARLQKLLHTPALFALVFQGIQGLIQVAAFFGLKGEAYLRFSEAYLAGTLVSMLFVLNFENMALGQKASRSVWRLFGAVWLMGLMSTLPLLTTANAIPSWFTFACFGVCFRVFLGWATHARPWAPTLILAGLLVALTVWRGHIVQVLFMAMLAFPLAFFRSQRPPVAADDGVWAVLRVSLAAFTKYLPHTLSGLLVGYVDRYAALHVVGGLGAEIYLRTVQVCSWGAFLAYPVIFQARARVLKATRLDMAQIARVLGGVFLALAVSVSLVLAGTLWSGRLPGVSPAVVLVVFLAIGCAQSYQVVSALNFVGQRFGIINKITLVSAATVVGLAVALVPNWPTPLTLAVVLLCGWLVQLTATVAVVQNRPA